MFRVPSLTPCAALPQGQTGKNNLELGQKPGKAVLWLVRLKWMQIYLFMSYFSFFTCCKSFLCTWGCLQVPAAGLPRGYGCELGVERRDRVLGPRRTALETSLKMLPKNNREIHCNTISRAEGNSYQGRSCKSQ